MKKSAGFSVLVLLVICLMFVVASADSDTIKVIVDGNPLTMEVAPISQDGRTLIPLKAVMQALNAKVDWDEKTESVSVIKGTTKLTLKINSTEALLNGKTITLDVPPIIVNDRTMVPVRFVSENLGVYIEWNDEENAVVIDPSITYYKMEKRTTGNIYEGGWRDGKACRYGKIRSENGNLVAEGFFQNGDLAHGKLYFPSGKLRYEGDYYNGKSHGKGTLYWEETGNIQYKGDFADNYADGYGWYYSKDGTLIFEGNYKSGDLNGQGFKYYTNGNIAYKGDFVKGIFEGYGYIYRTNGTLQFEGEFANGKCNGKGIEYFENGNVRFVGTYVDNKRNGYGKLYYDTGELQVEGPFVNDKANGTCIKYDKNGESMTVEYKENLPIDFYNRIHNIGS